ncbi:MAG TPA: hypothetical protein VF693_10225 [Allosphingosinicella sp.]|jgi:uncharacterized OB-fold protein
MPWWIRRALGEFPAVAVTAALLAAVILAFVLVYLPTDSEGELVQGEVVGFHGYLSKSRMQNVVLASVRLDGGPVVNVRIATSSAASRCRVGDRLAMVRRAHRLIPQGSGCGRP